LLSCVALVLAEVTSDQPGAVGASGVLATAAAALPVNGPACLSAKNESPGELPDEPVIPPGGFAAKLSIARRTPAKQRVKATKMRGLKTPDSEAGFFSIMILFVG
jgi:hypothetical protein